MGERSLFLQHLGVLGFNDVSLQRTASPQISSVSFFICRSLLFVLAKLKAFCSGREENVAAAHHVTVLQIQNKCVMWSLQTLGAAMQRNKENSGCIFWPLRDSSSQTVGQILLLPSVTAPQFMLSFSPCFSCRSAHWMQTDRLFASCRQRKTFLYSLKLLMIVGTKLSQFFLPLPPAPFPDFFHPLTSARTESKQSC